MKIGFISLGCPKNQLDTEVMLHEVVAAGYELTSEDIDADIIIINPTSLLNRLFDITITGSNPSVKQLPVSIKDSALTVLSKRVSSAV